MIYYGRGENFNWFLFDITIQWQLFYASIAKLILGPKQHAHCETSSSITFDV